MPERGNLEAMKERESAIARSILLVILWGETPYDSHVG